MVERILAMRQATDIRDDPRVERILELVFSLASGDLDARCPLGEKGDELDAIIGGLNMLAEEMQATSSENKEAGEKLKKEKEKFRILIDHAPFGVLYMNKDVTHHYINKKFTEIFGYSLKDIPDGRTWERLAFPDETYRSMVSSKWNNFIKRSNTGDSEILLFNTTCKDGTEKQMLTSIVKLEEDDLLIIYEDNTEKKALEKRLLQAQKMEAIGTLAAGVAHDLNNILSGIVSYPELILMDLPDDSPMKDPILTIQESGKKASAIVQDLLTLARRGVSTNQILNLNAVIGEYLRSPEYKRLLIHHPKVEIKVDLAEDLLNMTGSSVHISKMLMNLVSNASEAVITKGRVIISTENRYIDKQKKMYDYVDEGEYVVLSVFDNGIGISNTELRHIFEPFYTKKVMGRSGTGLGMSVVWGTVKDHNGYIDIKSREGEGTLFEIYLPATRSKIESTDKPKIEHYIGRGEKILVVDDIREQRIIASNILSRLNYSVDAVPSGEQAIEYLKKKTIDLVILDMIMTPGIDGLDTYKCMIKIRPDLKVIIASGFAETERVREALNLGVNEYIKKPYSVETIGMSVKKALGKKYGDLDISQCLR